MPDSRVAALAAQIVMPYLKNHSIETEQVPRLVRTVVDTLSALGAGLGQPKRLNGTVTPSMLASAPQAALRPRRKLIAGPGKKMDRPPNSETTQCLHCERRVRDLARHVWDAHGMNFERYQQWFPPPPDGHRRISP